MGKVSQALLLNRLTTFAKMERHKSLADSFASVSLKQFSGRDRMTESVSYGTNTALKCSAIENPAQTLPVMEGIHSEVLHWPSSLFISYSLLPRKQNYISISLFFVLL